MIGEFTKAEGGEDKLVLKSLLMFAGVYIAATVIFMIVQTMFDFDMKMADGIVSLMVAANMAGSTMVARVGRAPEKEERFKLQIGSLFVVLAFQFLGGFAVVSLLSSAGDKTLTNMIGSMPLMLAAVVVVVFVLLNYGIISMGIRSGIKAAIKKLPESDETVKETFS